MNLPDPIAALVALAVEPQRIRDLYYCRCCSRITTTLEAGRAEHRADCPVPHAREWMERLHGEQR